MIWGSITLQDHAPSETVWECGWLVVEGFISYSYDIYLSASFPVSTPLSGSQDKVYTRNSQVRHETYSVESS